MMAVVAPISERLEKLVHASNLRNFRATSRHYDACGEREFAGVVQPQTDGSYDRYVRSMIEGGICWRDGKARRSV